MGSKQQLYSYRRNHVMKIATHGDGSDEGSADGVVEGPADGVVEGSADGLIEGSADG